MIKISVCIPVYGVEKYIERCVRSLFEQTLTDGVEFIFVNDCTPDDSINILRRLLTEYPQRASQTRIIDHEVNKGLGAARNTALAAASGEYVTHVDSDDFLKLNALEKLLETARINNADFVTAGVCIQFADHEEILPTPTYKCKADFLADMLSRKISCNIWNNLIRRNLYTQNNITVPENLNMGEDFSVTPKLIYFAGEIAFCPEVLYCYYRANSTSYCNTLKLKNLQDIVHAHDLLYEFFSNANPPVAPELLQTMREGNFIEMLWLAAGNFEQLQWLRKNFSCRVWKLTNKKSLKITIANFFFQLNCLRLITWGTGLLRLMRALKKG